MSTSTATVQVVTAEPAVATVEVGPVEVTVVATGTIGPRGPAGEGTGTGVAVDSVDGRTGAVTLSDLYQPLDSDLTAIAALATTAFGRSFLELANAGAGRTLLALGSAAIAATGDFDPVGAAAAAQAGSQPLDSDLTAIAALSTTAFGRSLLALADATAGRTALGLGTAAVAASGDFQPNDSDLTAIAALSTTAFGRGLLTLADAAALRTAAGLGTIATHPTTDFVAATEKGAANGVATLDGSGVVPTAQLPPLAINEVFVVGSQAAMLALTAQRGDVARRTDTTPNKLFLLTTDDPTVLANWLDISVTDAVSSVEGRFGAVTLGDLYQPLDSDLTAIAALVTTSFGRSLLEAANAAALRTLAGLGTAATQDKVAAGAAGVLDATDPTTTNTRTPTDNSVSTAKLVDDAVTFAKVQNVAAARILGRNTAGSGDIEELTAATIKALLAITEADVTGLVADLAAKAADSAVVHNTGTETIAGAKTFTSDVVVPDEAYDATAWNGSLEVPTKNAVRDRIETASRVLAEAHADNAINTTTAETTVGTFSITGGSVAAGDWMLLDAILTILNSTGGAVTFLWKLKLGATTVITTSSMSEATNPGRRAFSATARIGLQAVNSQVVLAEFKMGGAGTATGATGNKNDNVMAVGVATEDLSATVNLVLTVQMNASSASAEVLHKASTLDVFKKAA